MEHPKELKELSSKMYYEMDNYHQITIDLLEELEWRITSFVPPDTLIEIEKVRALNEVLASIHCKIGDLMEVIDKQHQNDICALNELSKIITYML